MNSRDTVCSTFVCVSAIKILSQVATRAPGEASGGGCGPCHAEPALGIPAPTAWDGGRGGGWEAGRGLPAPCGLRGAGGRPGEGRGRWAERWGRGGGQTAGAQATGSRPGAALGSGISGPAEGGAGWAGPAHRSRKHKPDLLPGGRWTWPQGPGGSKPTVSARATPWVPDTEDDRSTQGTPPRLSGPQAVTRPQNILETLHSPSLRETLPTPVCTPYPRSVGSEVSEGNPAAPPAESHTQAHPSQPRTQAPAGQGLRGALGGFSLV